LTTPSASKLFIFPHTLNDPGYKATGLAGNLFLKKYIIINPNYCCITAVYRIRVRIRIRVRVRLGLG